VFGRQRNIVVAVEVVAQHQLEVHLEPELRHLMVQSVLRAEAVLVARVGAVLVARVEPVLVARVEPVLVVGAEAVPVARVGARVKRMAPLPVVLQGRPLLPAHRDPLSRRKAEMTLTSRLSCRPHTHPVRSLAQGCRAL
jgi:hypothetical protein